MAKVPELAYSESRRRSTLAAASDRELLWALRGEDEFALEELIERKTRGLIAMVTRIVGDVEEAKDLVQLTFLRMWENRLRFDERWSPNTWIYRIATNLAIDAWRSKKSRDRSVEPMRFHLLRRADESGKRELAELEEKEVAAIFTELSAGLSEKQRLVFVLREIEGMSSAEVAEIVDCEESTVRNHLFNARRVLRAGLLERFPEYARGWMSRRKR